MRFGERTIWSNLSFNVEPGEMLAIIGANGSGKYLLLRDILGLHPLASGTIRFDGSQIRRGNPEIGFIPQHRGEDHGLPMRARDLVRFGLDGHRPGISIDTRSAKNQVERALTAVAASDLGNHRIGSLSGGELQRVRVAQALIGEPKLLLADEPLSALDLRILTPDSSTEPRASWSLSQEYPRTIIELSAIFSNITPSSLGMTVQQEIRSLSTGWVEMGRSRARRSRN
jgi:zinc/manganese transport system ATP-binding protein